MARAIAAALVLALLAIPLAAIRSSGDRLTILPSLQVDAPAYDAIASAIARTHSVDPIPPLQPPGFVMTLGALYAITGHSWLAAKVFLWCTLVACVLMAARLGWLIYRHEAAAWAAAWLTAASPMLQAYTGTIQYELVAACWLLALLLIADWVTRRSSRGGHLAGAAALGALAGAAMLTREVFVAVIPLLALAVVVLRPPWSRGREPWVAGLVVLTCATIPVVSWARVQSQRAGRVVTVSDKGPLVLAFGNNPFANGTFNAPLTGVGEPSGVAFMRAQPRRTTELLGRKFLYFWGVLRDGWNVPRLAAIWMVRATVGALPLELALAIARGGGILLLLLTALALWPWRRWQEWWLLPAVISGILAIHLVTVSSHRFSVPVLPVVFAIIAGPLASAARRLTATGGRRVALVAVVLIVTAAQSASPPLRYTLRASEMDGRDAENVTDAVRGRVRFASASRGPRAAVLLGDEYLARGHFAVRVALRADVSRAAPPIRMWLQHLDAARICEITPTVSTSKWTDVIMQCQLPRDSVVTLVVETTAVTDVWFESVAFTWP
ncbi:MAG TPA: hypothetical protein VNJ02_16570 [Vicinamibacterales bacterium]|nr:hypothetical protein [Vicinamibacterales bacterium]